MQTPVVFDFHSSNSTQKSCYDVGFVLKKLRVKFMEIVVLQNEGKFHKKLFFI